MTTLPKHFQNLEAKGSFAFQAISYSRKGYAEKAFQAASENKEIDKNPSMYSIIARAFAKRGDTKSALKAMALAESYSCYAQQFISIAFIERGMVYEMLEIINGIKNKQTKARCYFMASTILAKRGKTKEPFILAEMAGAAKKDTYNELIEIFLKRKNKISAYRAAVLSGNYARIIQCWCKKLLGK